MSKIAFITKKFHGDRTRLINTANEIVESYHAQGYRLTLRQLYYQFVSRDLIPNSERSYKNLGATISEGRLAGLIDWDAIEDRVRRPRRALQFENIQDRVESAVANYRLPRWKGQLNYVELWVEKDALAGVLEPIAHEFHITLMVNRGYSSQSAMFESAQRFLAESQSGERGLYLLYLGDHDPSGEDMVRDVKDRLALFGVEGLFTEKIALTMKQVEKYNPPPNPAKMSDSRAVGYVARHGESSWEVDALEPKVLVKLITDRLKKLVDQKMMDAIISHEESDKAALIRATNKIK